MTTAPFVGKPSVLSLHVAMPGNTIKADQGYNWVVMRSGRYFSSFLT